MLQLQNSGLGTNKGIPTTILAAATIDNIYGVTAFNSQLYNILSPPVELFIGIVCGCAFGFFLWYFPNQKQTNLHSIRAFILSFIAMSVLIGTKTIQHTLVGPVVLVLMCVVAAYRWKSDNSKGVHREQACFKILWDIALQPFLFALIGLLFDFSQISWTSFGFACIYVLIGVVVRFISIFGMSLLMKDFNFKEKLFISICFFPKATVQAVLAPIILQEVDKDPTKFNSKHVQLVFQTCILSILLTAPLGQLIIWHLGKRALHKRHPTNQSKSKAYEVTKDSKSDTIHPTIAGHPSSTGSIQNGNKEQLSDSAIPMS
ncbi:Na-H-Exchanger domain-containing protein [Aphelenchoides bicaudatus]|nr:Na-H-Exchanger domain-containing protein [Aphelenchoides bicaudatus]